MTENPAARDSSIGDELRDLLDALDALDEIESRAAGTAPEKTADAAVAEDRSIIRARARLACEDSSALGDELADVRRRLRQTRRRAQHALEDGRGHQAPCTTPPPVPDSHGGSTTPDRPHTGRPSDGRLPRQNSPSWSCADRPAAGAPRATDPDRAEAGDPQPR